MQKYRLWLPILVSCVMALAAGAAASATSGSRANQVVLGQTLDFTVQVRGDPSEVLTAECVRAQITQGDRRIPPSAIRSELTPTGGDSYRVRVLTQQALAEPVLSVQLTLGCRAPVTRNYVLLAELPTDLAPAAASTAVAETARQLGANASAVKSPGAVAAPSARPQNTAAGPGKPRAEGRERRAETSTRAAGAAGRAAPSGARLKLERSEPVLSAEALAVEQAIEAVAYAASSARAAASKAAVSADRIASLERSMAQLRGNAAAQDLLTAQLRERLQGAENTSRWFWPLLLAVAGLSGVAAWLAWRARSQPRSGAGFLNLTSLVGDGEGMRDLPSSRLPTSPLPFVSSDGSLPPEGFAVSSTPAPAATPSAPARKPIGGIGLGLGAGQVAKSVPTSTATQAQVDAAAHAAMEQTRPLPPTVAIDGAVTRAVSIEELIDLEQQAEFFVVLGQDDAAIELLVEHLRNTGGSSPLPYLKLLEIYHRTGDRKAYDLTRERFNQRFNAYAPEWDMGLQHGRCLEDYTGVAPRLVQVWPRPLDAMAELEALLFRKSRGDLFDLPAYREVLMLYAMARDLHDRESADSGNVDLLLPLPDGGEFSSTAPHPYFGLETESAGAAHAAKAKVLATLDLDLSAAEKPSSIFDTFDDRPQPTRR